MPNIRKRKHFRFVVISISILSIGLSLIFILDFMVSKIHKNELSKKDIPSNAALYVSMKNVDKTALSFIKSVYAYKVMHDENLFEFSALLKSSEDIIENFKNMKFPFGLFGKYAFSVKSVFILYEKKTENMDNADYAFIFDIGVIPSIIFNYIFSNNKIIKFSKENERYIKTKEKYKDIIIKSVSDEKNKETFYLCVQKGIMIISPSLQDAKNIIDSVHYTKNKKEKTNAQRYKATFRPDISFYLNLAKCSSFFGTEKISALSQNEIYGYMKIGKKESKSDIYFLNKKTNEIKYKTNKHNRNEIRNYVPQNAAFYISVNTFSADLYKYAYVPLFQKINDTSDNKFINNIAYINSMYDLSNIVSGIDEEVAFFGIEDIKTYKKHPVIAAKLTSEAITIPLLEETLTKNFGGIKKEVFTYNNEYIYLYQSVNGKPFCYTSKNGIFFFSYFREPLMMIIDNYKTRKNLSVIFDKNKINTKNADYIFAMDFSKSIDILEYAGINFKTYSYPTYITASSKVYENMTFIQAVIKVNLSENK